jgi:biotin-(acetyl-CoA carboxylase) ligase
VYLNGKKICGILTELAVCGTQKTAVVGMGVNTALPEKDIPPELRGIMTSAAAEGLHVPARETVIRATVAALDRMVYEEGALRGDGAVYAERLNRRSYLTGRTVAAGREGTALRGAVLGISPSGGLVLLTE